MTIVKAVQTCTACPSQWDAWDDEGNYWYLRYRAAHGSAKQYPDEHRHESDGPLEEPAQALYFENGSADPLDGMISLEEFCALAGLDLSPDLDYTDWYSYAADELLRVLEGLVNGDLTFINGTLTAVHGREACEGRGLPCCIHDPSDHHMLAWPMNWRGDTKVMERLCPHGIGHPDPDHMAYVTSRETWHLLDGEDPGDMSWQGIHGCDGCCTRSTNVATPEEP